MSKAYTVSCTRDHHTEEHSRRSYTPMSAEWSLRNENVVIYDCGNDREHFNSFFRPAIEEYNAKQKRKDRKKDLDYLSGLENGTEGYGKGDKKEKPFYHSVIQIGNSKTNGVTDNSFDKHHWRQLKAEEKFKEAAEYVRTHLNRDPAIRDFKEILIEIGQEILENRDGRYDGVLVHGLNLHCDEPAGTIHLDLRATFYCDGEKTGVSKRVSQNKALKKLGFVTTPEKTNLTRFEEAIKNRVAEKMKERGYERKILGEHRPHEKNEVYQMRMDAEEAEKKKVQAEAEAKKILNDAEQRWADAAGYEDYLTESFQTEVQRVNSELAAENKAVDKREVSVAAREMKVIEREDALTGREAELEKREDDLERIATKKDANLEKKREQLEQEQEEFWDQIDEWREWYLELLQSINPDPNPADDDMELDELQEKLREEFQGWEDRIEAQRQVLEEREMLVERKEKETIETLAKTKKLLGEVQEFSNYNQSNNYSDVLIVRMKNGRPEKTGKKVLVKTLSDVIREVDQEIEAKREAKLRELDEKVDEMSRKSHDYLEKY